MQAYEKIAEANWFRSPSQEKKMYEIGIRTLFPTSLPHKQLHKMTKDALLVFM
jgi:hypothetical protein